MKFDELISNFLSEKKERANDEPTIPFSIEVTKDLTQSTAYNEIGEIIIKLSAVRNKLKT